MFYWMLLTKRLVRLHFVYSKDTNGSWATVDVVAEEERHICRVRFGQWFWVHCRLKTIRQCCCDQWQLVNTIRRWQYDRCWQPSWVALSQNRPLELLGCHQMPTTVGLLSNDPLGMQRTVALLCRSLLDLLQCRPLLTTGWLWLNERYDTPSIGVFYQCRPLDFMSMPSTANNILTTFEWPWSHAMLSGVPSSFIWFTWMPSTVNNISTTFTWPRWHAVYSAAQQLLFAWFTRIPFTANNILTTFERFFSHATFNGVHPLMFVWLTWMLSVASNLSTIFERSC